MGMHVRSGSVPVLLGRQRECQALDSLMEDLRSGRGWALVVRGEAGVGKSALLESPRGHHSGKLARLHMQAASMVGCLRLALRAIELLPSKPAGCQPAN